MGARGCCIGLGEFLTLAATALMILVNIGQITDNTVSRHIYLTSIDTLNLQSAIAAQSGASASVANVYASDQSSPLLTNAGLRNYYYWGMYSVCGGEGVSGARSCGPRSFGHRFEPITVLEQEQSQGVNISAVLPDNVFRDNMYLGNFTQAAFYLLFIGTVASGVAFLIGIASHRFAFLFAAIFSFIAAVALAVGAAIWTAIVYKVREAVNPANVGLFAYYGNAIWMSWGAFAASLLAFPFLVVSCCVGRNSNKY